MDTINFSNDHFRKIVKQLQATPQSFMESKYEKPVREAVPFKKKALDEINPNELTVGSKYNYKGTTPATGEMGEMGLTYKGTVTDSTGTTYHLFADDKTKTSGMFSDENIEDKFSSFEEKETEDYDSFLKRFKGE